MVQRLNLELTGPISNRNGRKCLREIFGAELRSISFVESTGFTLPGSSSHNNDRERAQNMLRKFPSRKRQAPMGAARFAMIQDSTLPGRRSSKNGHARAIKHTLFWRKLESSSSLSKQNRFLEAGRGGMHLATHGPQSSA